MGSLSVWNDRKGISPRRPKRARIGGLLFALAVVLVAIWLLSRVP
jgi:flagellar biogenesis protein FliO